MASIRAARRAISTSRLLASSTAVLISRIFIGSETGIQSLWKTPVRGSNLPAPRRATNKVVNADEQHHDGGDREQQAQAIALQLLPKVVHTIAIAAAAAATAAAKCFWR